MLRARGCCEQELSNLVSSASVALAASLCSPLRCSEGRRSPVPAPVDEPDNSERVGREPWSLPSQVGRLVPFPCLMDKIITTEGTGL